MKTSLCHPSSKPSGRAPTQPLHYIKHLKLDMNKLKYQEEHLMRYIIDNLLWMSHPNTLTLSIPTSFSKTALVSFFPFLPVQFVSFFRKRK